MKLKSFFALTLLSASPLAHAQLVITTVAPSSLAVAMQSSPADQATVMNIYPFAPAITLEGRIFLLRPDFTSLNFNSQTVAQLAYLGKESIDPNTFGVADGAISSPGTVLTALYSPYSAASASTAYSLRAQNGGSQAIFYNVDSAPTFGGVKLMSDTLHFVTYEWTDGFTTLELFGVDDRGTQYVDFNDGTFLLTIAAIPEPSTYGLFAGMALVAAVAIRRKKRFA